MPVVPAPSDFDSLGGQKENFEEPSIPNQQLSASEWNEVAASVAAVSQTATSGEVTFTYLDGYVEVLDHVAVWGSSAFVAPSVIRNSSGVFTVTLPESITDALGTEHEISLRSGWVNVEADARYGGVAILSSNELRVRIRHVDGATDDGDEQSINVFYRVR